jgi:hypothetical protein
VRVDSRPKKIVALALLAAACGHAPAPRDSQPNAPAPSPSAGERGERAQPAGDAAIAAEPGDAAPASSSRTWDFESDQVDAPPVGFSLAQTDGGRPGRWIVRVEPSARQGSQVLAQVDEDRTDGRFPLAVAETEPLADVRVTVRCRMIEGRVDRACGLVFRYRDQDNYYVVRANALEGNVRLYTVRAGRRRQIASWDGAVSPDAWHELGASIRGNRIEVTWDGTRIIEQTDTTFPDAGRVGVWTKADSVTEFDDLTVAPLVAGE